MGSDICVLMHLDQLKTCQCGGSKGCVNISIINEALTMFLNSQNNVFCASLYYISNKRLLFHKKCLNADTDSDVLKSTNSCHKLQCEMV